MLMASARLHTVKAVTGRLLNSEPWDIDMNPHGDKSHMYKPHLEDMLHLEHSDQEDYEYSSPLPDDTSKGWCLYLRQAWWRFKRRRKFLVAIICPLIILPAAMVLQTKASKCGCVILLMAVLWVSGAVHPSVTALVPLAAFPMFGISAGKRVCRNYFRDAVVAIFMDLCVAYAVEYCNLHRRITLKGMLAIGTHPHMLLFSVMATSTFASLWLSNSATAAMILPIVETITDEAVSRTPRRVHQWSSPTKDPYRHLRQGKHRLVKRSSEQDPREQLVNGIMLGSLYSIFLGGNGTVVGANNNIIVLESIIQLYTRKLPLNYTTWLLFCIPNAIICALAAWLYLQYVYLGGRFLHSEAEEANIREVIQRNYNDLGPMTYHEYQTLALLILLVIFWITRDFGFIEGWSKFFKSSDVEDSLPGVIILFLLFALPCAFDYFLSGFDDRLRDRPPPPGLMWPVLKEKLPWGVLFLLGGTFAMTDASLTSGLTMQVQKRLTIFKIVPHWIVCTVTMLLFIVLTQFTANLVTAALLLPLAIYLAGGISINPLYLLLPANFASSFAFILPSAGVTTAMFVDRTTLPGCEVMVIGIWVVVICTLITLVMIHTYGDLLFNWSEIMLFSPPATQH